MKIWLTVFASLLTLSVCAQSYVLKGRITGLDSGFAYIRHRSRPGVDSARIIHGRFFLKGRVSGPEFCAFGLRSSGRKDYYFSIFIEPAKMRLTATTAALNDTAVRISGSRTQKEFQRFKRQSARYPGQARALFDRLSPAIRNSPFGNNYP